MQVTELFMLPKADLLIMFEKYSTLKQRLSVIAGALLLRIKVRETACGVALGVEGVGRV